MNCNNGIWRKLMQTVCVCVCVYDLLPQKGGWRRKTIPTGVCVRGGLQ